MNLRTLLLLSATGMLATGVVVWKSVGPAHGKSPTPATATITEPAKPAAPPPVDRSHFQAGKTLMIEGRLGHAVLPANIDNETYLFVDVSAADVVATTPAPVELSIVIDKSGSMSGKRLVNAVAAARTAIQRLKDGDIVSVVAFNTATDVVIRPTAIDSVSRPRMIAQLASIRAGGDTCISCGVDTAMRLLSERDGMIDRMLVLSDGQPTAGVRDVDGFRRIAENCRRMGASVTTIGVDVSYDERVMATIARSSNGHHYFVADPAGLPAIFDKEMSSLSRTVAKRAELAIDLSPGVYADHVFDREVTNEGGRLVVPLGTFSATDHKTVLVRLRVPRGAAGERPVAAVRLRYDDLVTTKDGTCEGSLATTLTGDTSKISSLDAIVSARLSATETARTLEQANALFRAGRSADAQGIIAQQRAKVAATRAVAREHAPADRKDAIDNAFGANEGVLGGAGAGFDKKPGAPAPAADPQGQHQVRRNQEDATKATE